MIIEIATLPPAVQAWVKTLPFDEEIHLTKTNDSLVIQQPLFDIERMKQAIKGCETKEDALKNGVVVPDFETIEELQYWTKHILPTLKAGA